MAASTDLSPYLSAQYMYNRLVPIMRYAMQLVRSQRFSFTYHAKGIRRDGKTDWQTSADSVVQTVMIRQITQAFPGFGILAEEDDVCIPCTIPDVSLVFTVDPVDGTWNFKNKDSVGIGSQISLCMNGRVIIVVVVNVLTEEFYLWHHDEKHPQRMDYLHAEPLVINPELPLSEQNVYMRFPTGWPKYHPIFNRLGMYGNGLFKGIEVGGGSIGVTMSRLWQGSIGAYIAAPPKLTPWDHNPLVGMHHALNFCAFRADHATNGLIEYDFQPVFETLDEDMSGTLIIHTSRIPELATWCQKERIPIYFLTI